jgi:hypothetical protein
MAVVLRSIFGLDAEWLALPAVQLGIGAVLGAATYIAAHLALWWLSGRPDGAERILIKALSGPRGAAVPARAS